MFKWLTHSPDGFPYPKVGFVAGRDAFSLPQRNLFFQLPFGWEINVNIAFQVSPMRLKQLANGDFVNYHDPIEPDDWRNKRTRRDGSDW